VKIGLGTVQFGLDYGISNKSGKPSLEAVKKILRFAHQEGINFLDTAFSYGNSEEILGKCFDECSDFEIITKTPKFSEKISLRDVKNLEVSLFQSLSKLKKTNIYGLLIHDSIDLINENGCLLWNKMCELKSKGLVRKIGVSVYSAKQIDAILENFDIDLIQLPINIFDQRLLKSGHLKKLKVKNIEIHARSVFLQGLLLMDLKEIPSQLQKFGGLIGAYDFYLKNNNLSRLNAALGFILGLKEIDKIILGINSLKELVEIVNITKNFSSKFNEKFNFGEFACFDEKLLNPSVWTKGQI